MSLLNRFKTHAQRAIILGAVFFTSTSFAANEIAVPVSSGDEITIERYPAKGEYLLLWLAPEYGFRPGHRAICELRRGHRPGVDLGGGHRPVRQIGRVDPW